MHCRFLPSSPTLLAFLLTAFVLPLAAFHQAPAREKAAISEPTGTGRISGAVATAATGAGVRRVRVMLSGFIPSPRTAGAPVAGVSLGALVSSGAVIEGTYAGGVTVSGSAGASQPAGRVQREGETDENGRVEFGGLPAAMYSLMVMSPPAGFIRPSSSQPVRLEDGRTATHTIRLDRGGAITGRVVDEVGEPVTRATVTAYLKRGGSGAWFGANASPASTDDRGQYRIYGLAPGDYYVVASYFNPMPMRRPEQSGPRNGPLPTYYPGSATLESARPLTVRAGQDTEGVDIALVAGALGRVVVTMTDSGGAPISARGGGYASLSSRNSPLVGGRGGSWMPDGSFVFNDVPPGDYYVTGNATRGEGPEAEREGAFVPVTVNGGDVSVTVKTNKGATLSGRVVFEGTLTSPPPLIGNVPVGVPPDALRPMVVVRPTASRGSPVFWGGKPERVGEDGTFRITGVRGSVLLTCSAAAAALKAIRYAGQDLATTPLVLSGTETIDDIEVVLTYDTGNVMGTVLDDRGQPVPGAWLVVFPDDPNRWTPGNPLIRPTRAIDQPPPPLSSDRPRNPATSAATPGAAGPRLPRLPGEFFVTRLLPGRYLLATVQGEANGSISMQFDAETLSALREKATTVTVTVGETTTVTLRR